MGGRVWSGMHSDRKGSLLNGLCLKARSNATSYRPGRINALWKLQRTGPYDRRGLFCPSSFASLLGGINHEEVRILPL